MSIDRSLCTTIRCCGRLLEKAGIRHHLDSEQGVIRVVFCTTAYRNPRGERFAIVTLDAPIGSGCLRATIAPAFTAGPSLAVVCRTASALVDDLPSIGVRHDAATGSISLSCTLLLGRGRVSVDGICLLLDEVVSAAERCQRLLAVPASKPSTRDVGDGRRKAG